MSDWIADMGEKKVEHVSGFTIYFDGVPGTDHFTGTPRNYVKTMNPLELSRLIREGFAAYQAAWKLAPAADAVGDQNEQSS